MLLVAFMLYGCLETAASSTAVVLQYNHFNHIDTFSLHAGWPERRGRLPALWRP